MLDGIQFPSPWSYACVKDAKQINEAGKQIMDDWSRKPEKLVAGYIIMLLTF